MKLVKLKCPSCGSKLEVDGGKETFFCKYCRTTSLLDDEVIKVEHTIVDKNKENALKIFKGFGIAWLVGAILTGLITIGIIGTIIYFVVKATDNISDNLNNQVNEEVYDQFDINKFNNSLEMYSGTEWGSSVGRLLDKVVTINKTQKERTITVIYGSINTTDPDEIVNIKHSLGDFTDYEVYLEYDNIGFINKVTIEKI